MENLSVREGGSQAHDQSIAADDRTAQAAAFGYSPGSRRFDFRG